MKRNERALDEIVGRLEKSWRGEARKAIDRLYQLIDDGMKTEQAVKKLEKEFPALFHLAGLPDALVEAAAYGYGIMPSIMTRAERTTWERSLSAAWTSDDMNLSEKVHGFGVRMRDTIVQTINQQMDKNATWVEASRALYDGYVEGQKEVIRQQDFPQYLKKVTDAARAAAGDKKEIAKEAERAARRVQELSKSGAPTKALQAAYNQLVKASESGSEEALNNAIDVAVNEKSRYVADRIIRTETARAYNSGFLSSAMADDDVVALRWKLNTRHPVFDICDMYAKADMFGLGPGIFPKKQLPRTSIPVHPHCMCRFVEVYDGEVDMDKMRDRQQEAGEEWLKKLSPKQQRAVLGIEGRKQFLADGSWQEYMRGWVGIGKPKYADLSNDIPPMNLQLHAMRKNEAEFFKNHINAIPQDLNEKGLPTDKYLKAIANVKNAQYNVGKLGADRYYSDDGTITLWPPFDGAVKGSEKAFTIKEDTIISRIGYPNGNYASPDGVEREKRSLPFNKKAETDDPTTKEHRYKVKKPLPCIMSEVAPWFDDPGGGVQYKFYDSVKKLVADGFLEEVF